LLLYRDQQDKIVSLDKNTRIPVMFDGVVVSIIHDFLGRSVIVEHGPLERDRGRFCTIYAHTKPLKDLQVGQAVKQGHIMAELAHPGPSNFPMAPHLHLSAGRIFRPISYDRLDWNTIGDSDALTLLDPIDLIEWKYRVEDKVGPARPAS
ncbi:MAG: M23 family metallopeptidase, partial [Deltaproteobacteria bacterium]|nr:M23 family metallopeptidase [Deltaproteobacteria bacterium]